MTNRELLRAPRERLSTLDRQRQQVLQVESCPVPCPACEAPVDAVTASGRDIDEYPFGREPPTYRCPHCAAVLDRVTPLVAFGPGWHWQLNHEWLTERLRRARLYDREHEGET
jgi:hypothetical protein